MGLNRLGQLLVTREISTCLESHFLMKILFTSTKGTGHFRPLVPYIEELQRRGHDVQIAAPESLRNSIEEAGVPFVPFDPPTEEQLSRIWESMEGLPKEVVLHIAIRDAFAGLWAQAALPIISRHVKDWKPNLIVRDSAELAAVIAADQASVPHARVEVHNGITESLFIELGSDPVDVLRLQVGLPADNGLSLRSELAFTSFPKSLDTSETLNGEDKRFRVRSSIVIEQPRSEPASWAPKRNVPFVYVTFGTLAGEDEKEQALYKATLAAIAPLPIKALLTTGPVMATAELGDIPQNVIVKQWVTQSEVLLLASAVVCHGGSGTLLGALAAGLPLVVAPMFADQPDNARQVECVGAGIAVLEPDVTLLRAAIQRVLEEKEFREKAAGISVEISALPDIRAAVDAMLEHIVV